MLKSSFQHIHGIGQKTEADLWSKGILDLDGLERACHNSNLANRFVFIKKQIEESKKALKEKNYAFFAKNLPSKEHWRIYMEAIKSKDYAVAYIDIETSFTSDGEQFISTIALYDENEILCFIRGRNLHEFPEIIKRYSIIVTYSGKTFDVPFIEKYFQISLTNTHIDLRYVLSGMKYKGGLKKCEKALGFQRKESDGIEGHMAPFLWNAFENGGSIRHLNTLIAYNIEDVLSLYHIMQRVIEIRLADTPFKDIYWLDDKPFPTMPYRTDKQVLSSLKTMNYKYK